MPKHHGYPVPRLALRIRDGGLPEVGTLSPRGFFGGVDRLPAVGEFAHVQLFNPVTSSVVVGVRRVLVTFDATTVMELREDNVARATLDRRGAAVASNGQLSAAELRSASLAAQQGTILTLLRVGTLAGIPLTETYLKLLGPGDGLTVVPGAVTFRAVIHFEWVEVPLALALISGTFLGGA